MLDALHPIYATHPVHSVTHTIYATPWILIIASPPSDSRCSVLGRRPQTLSQAPPHPNLIIISPLFAFESDVYREAVQISSEERRICFTFLTWGKEKMMGGPEAVDRVRVQILSILSYKHNLVSPMILKSHPASSVSFHRLEKGEYMCE